ncbi:hypothetical protein O181_111490 [Austropuccinia psidii MF-1]|uniref:Uncharacterized protein n=1 Tax=Austropuccinia psidii MF-1 TaxID=1389203 RepID=A0A9Q3PSJ9_9BASI|nr:hypothetical protein [Austropuccinia psidii MF-1]
MVFGCHACALGLSHRLTPIVRPETFPTGNNRDIPVSVKELFYGSRADGVGISTKYLDRHIELISSSEEIDGHRKESGNSVGLDTHLLNSTITKDKSLVEKSKNFVRGLVDESGPRKGQQPCGSSL